MKSISKTNPSTTELNKRIKELESNLENVHEEKDELFDTFRSLNLIAKNANALYSINDFDIKCKFKYVSPSVTKLAGYSPEEMIGKSAFDFVHPKDKKNIVMPLMKTFLQYQAKKILKGELRDKSQTFYYRCKDKSGNWRYAETTSNLVGNKLIMVTIDVGEQKTWEKKLAQTEVDYKNLLDNLQDIYYRLNKDGIITDINPAIKDVSGFKQSDIIGQDVRIFFTTDDQRRGFINSIKKNGIVKNYELDFIVKDGSKVFVSANAYIIKNDGGEPIGIEGILRNNTEWKLAEAALVTSEKNTKFLADTALELLECKTLKSINTYSVKKLHEIINREGLVFTADYDYKSELWEMQEFEGLKPFAKKLVSMLGYDISKMSGTLKPKYNLLPGKLTRLDDSLFELTRGVVPKKLNNSVKQLLSIKNIYCIPFHKENEIHGFVTILTNFKTKELNKILIEAFITQVSTFYENIKIDQELTESKERYKDLVEKADIAILVDDVDGKFTYFNDTFPKLYNYTAEEIKKKSIRELVYPEDVDIVMGYHNNRINGEKTISDYDFRAIKKDGSIMYLRVKASPVVDNGKIVGTRSYIWDITNKKIVQDALKESEEKFSKSFRSSPFLVGITTLKEGEFIEINEVFERVTGYSRDEIIGKTSTELKLWKNTQDRLSLTKALEKQGRVKDFEIGLRPKSGSTLTTLFSAEIIVLKGEPHIIAIVHDITEKKKAEKALKESENRFRLITDLTSDLAYAFHVHKNDEMTHLWSTGPMDKISGYSVSEVTEMGGWDKLVHENDMHLIGEQITSLFSQNSSQIDYRIKRKDGEIIWVRDYARPLVNEKTKRIEKIYGSIKEITEQKKAELEIQKLSTAVEQSPVTIVITDTNGKIEYVNPFFESLTGFSHKEALGLYPNIFKSGIHKQDYYDDLWSTITGGKVWNGEFLNKKKNGDLYWELATISPIKDTSGKITNFIAIKKDITSNKNLLTELTQSQERFQDLYDNAPDMYFSVSPQGIVLSVNEFGAKHLGYKKEELVGASVWIVVHPDDLKTVQTQIGKILKEKIPSSEIEFKKIRKDGTVLHVQERLQCLLDENNNCTELRINCRDITESKIIQNRIFDYQRNLKSLSNALIVAEEKERKQLATSLHDTVGQLLAMTNIKLSTLEKELDKSENIKKISDIKKLVADAINKSRHLTYELSPPILHELGLYAACKWYINQLNSQHNIKISIKGDEILYNISDEIKILIFRVIRELLNNIIKHADAPNANLAINKSDSYVKLIVQDEGVGFDANKLRETSIKGKKFGLFSITERIEYLGGSFDINSVKGKGTKITIEVPI